MIGSNSAALAAEWMLRKREEEAAVRRRRELEDKLVQITGFDLSHEGTVTEQDDQYVIRMTGRIDRKVDSDKVQELAAEAGLSEHLSSLFRWKPEINMAAWKAADPEITRALSGAITAKPGRPSFKITIEE